MYRACPKGKMEYLVMAAAFLAVAVFDGNVLIVIVCAACIGLAYTHLVRRKEQA